MAQHTEINAALAAIRAISEIYPDDIAAIVAALSCKINEKSNDGNKLAKLAVDSLDDLANYLQDAIEEEV